MNYKNFDEKLEELKKYSKAYAAIIKPNMEYDKDIRKELEYLSSLDQTVINPFLIGVISDYYDKKIEKKELIDILNLLQSYLWRRYITERKSNELNKIFSKIYPKISETNTYYENLKNELVNDFIDKHYGYVHTQSFESMVEDIAGLCRRKGGQLS